jgi:hypothetical protein
MRWIPVVLFVVALGCKKTEKQAVQKAVEDMRSGNTAAAGYVQDLQQDVRKAQDAAAKANAAIQQTSGESAKALQDAGE